MDPQNLTTVNKGNKEEVAVNKSSSPRILKNRKLIVVLGILLIITLGFAVYGVVVARKDKELNQLKSNIYKSITSGKYSDAKDEAKKAMTQCNNPFFVRKFIDSTIAEGNKTGTEGKALKDAMPYIDKLEKEDGGSYDSLISIGYAFETAGEYAKALLYYEKALKIKETADAYFHEGHVLEFLNRPTDSNNAFNKALQLDPNNPLALLSRASTLSSTGKIDEALNLYLSIASDKNNLRELRAEAYTGAALLTAFRGDNSSALNLAKSGYDIDPKYSQGEGAYGFLMVLNGSVGNGIKLQLEAIKNNPRVSYNYLTTGVSFRRLNYITDAISYQKKGVEMIEEDNTLVGSSKKASLRGKMYYELAQTYSLAKDRNNAILYLKQAVIEDPSLVNSLKKSVDHGYFAYIKSDPELTKYINKN